MGWNYIISAVFSAIALLGQLFVDETKKGQARKKVLRVFALVAVGVFGIILIAGGITWLMGIGGGGGTTTNPPTVSVPAGQSSSEGSANTNAAPPAKPQPGVGDIILFGNYNWRVLEVRDGKALIITEDIMTGRAYNEANEDVTWETCTLRTYLNGEFYDSFVPVDRKRIVDTEVRTPSNPWYETDGGKVVTDKIFLLSIEEVLKYFGNSKLGKEEYFWFSDENDEKRKANFENDYHWWWLRSPGILPIDAVCVLIGGYVGLGGIFVSESSGGVRPALWIDLGP